MDDDGGEGGGGATADEWFGELSDGGSFVVGHDGRW